VQLRAHWHIAHASSFLATVSTAFSQVSALTVGSLSRCFFPARSIFAHLLQSELPSPLGVRRMRTAKENPSMKIRPLHDRVIVKRLEADRASPGGIVIPDTAGDKPTQGRIVAVGNGRILDNDKVRPCDVKVGDKILFGKFSGAEVKVEGEELLVMREEDIMAVIESK
jgi:chaperonin GroES